MWFLFYFVPQQRELTGSSAENSSGVHWCRHRVRFNRVPEKVWEGVPKKAAEKIPGGFEWGRARSGSIGFRRRFQRRSGRLCRVREDSR
jgi:hypothetical protein